MLRQPLSKIALGIIIGAGFVSLSIPINYPHGFFNSLWPVLLGAAFATFLLSDVHAIQQARLIDVKKKKPYHGWLFLARAIVALLIALPIHGYSNKTLLLAVFIGSCFWLFFDIQINHYRNRPLLSIGRTAELDKFLRFMALGSSENTASLLAVVYKVSLIVWISWYYLK